MSNHEFLVVSDDENVENNNNFVKEYPFSEIEEDEENEKIIKKLKTERLRSCILFNVVNKLKPNFIKKNDIFSVNFDPKKFTEFYSSELDNEKYDKPSKQKKQKKNVQMCLVDDSVIQQFKEFFRNSFLQFEKDRFPQQQLLKQIKNKRLELLTYINVDDYFRVVESHVELLSTIFERKNYSNEEIQTLLKKQFSTFN